MSNVISMLLCPECQCPTLSLGDRTLKKQGLSLLFIKCVTPSCKFINEFYTSMPSGRGFAINKRTAYTMRVLGHGHSGIEKFTSLMNMPKPMTQNNYDKITLKISNVTKTVAEDAATDIREKYIYIVIML